MNCRNFFPHMGILLMLSLVACNLLPATAQPAQPIQPAVTTTQLQVTETQPQAAITQLQPTATQSQLTATPSLAIETATSVGSSPTPYPFILAEPGPYLVGKRTFNVEDTGRANRPVSIIVYYPALQPPEPTSSLAITDAEPDLSGAPYPLIVSSGKMARTMVLDLVPHGFVWAGVDKIDTYLYYDEQLYQQPLDILFALEQVASNPPAGLEGMIDAEHAGAIGYSFDGYNTLAMSGARLDPEFYLSQCPGFQANPRLFWGTSENYCGPANDWEAFSAGAGPALTQSQDGLWQPMTDPRIRAVMPMAGEGWLLFGERGLAAVDRPTLIIVGTKDELYPENALIFEHLGTPDKTMISFVGETHDMIFTTDQISRMAHFAVAFFGYYLQGRDDLAWYFSEEFVSQHPDLAWGVYKQQ
jgi:hypothetical protein